ncbi:transcription elongation factor B polypeptide 3 [Drosophila sulfurigaster albostrigata]|uniref:transcription elongation factor B polypeptide 3 n=1 Tax=Drosophila sulfurigaster albostrigata TaxID=89887 RepID=UPI002D21AFA8|nr:transcription elongation factor B polypeptide 3 [Drosophila sulfurigaster albostrigata]
MTSTSNLADVVRHYQRSIERHNEDETRLLHCITKLFNLPITFEHLQETGIGKTVNALRKINGEVGVAAKTLVTKWKAMVAAEEEPTTVQSSHSNSNEDDSNRSTNGRRSSEEDQDQENKGSNSSGTEDTRSTQKHKSSKSHEERRPKSSDHKSKSSSSSHSHSHNSSSSKSHSKSRSEGEKKHKSSSSDEKSKHRSSKEQKSSSSSSKSKDSISNHSNAKSTSESSKQKHHSSSSSSHKSDHTKSKHEKSKEDKSQHHSSEQKVAKDKSDKHKSSSTSTSSSAKSSSSSSSKRTRSPQRLDEESPKSKKPKSKPKADVVEQKETADGFDSSMGANFDDVLGMLNMPLSGKKSALKPKISPNKPTPTIATNTSSAAASNSAKRLPPTASVPSNMRLTSTSTKKPELLAPSAKLEPLDPSIALELPTISNNYKPMPLNQTVMDVVFNHGVSSSVHRAPRINESEALAAGISSKTMRTKIYSGVRTGQILQVPSLFDLCIRVLQKNIDALEYTGGVPFEVLRPVLERATPHQLLNFEEYNPYLMEDSDVLWQQHVHRHYRGQRREEMETWREMFLRCEDEKARRLSTIAENIKASQKISEAPVRKTQLAFVDSMVKPPRSVQRKQEQYGTNRKLIATPAARVAALSNVTPNAAKVGDARLRVLGSARDAAQVSAAPMRNKKAPLMAKALQLIRGRQRR